MNAKTTHEARDTKKTGMVWIWVEEECGEEKDNSSFKRVVIKVPIYMRCLSQLTPSICLSKDKNIQHIPFDSTPHSSLKAHRSS